MDYHENSIIGEVVSQDYRTATVFKSNEIDFCCNGNRTIGQAAKMKKIDVSILIGQLIDIEDTDSSDGFNFNSLPIDLLANYIERKHHAYVKEKIPSILQFLDKIRRVHGDRNPKLFKIYDLFEAAASNLIQHMKKEEMILFPYARQLADGTLQSSPGFGTIKNPIHVMMHEHEQEGGRFREIRSLTTDYTPPIDACSTYKVVFSMLEEFEEDLHKHIHLENNILFPKLIQTEKKKVLSERSSH